MTRHINNGKIWRIFTNKFMVYNNFGWGIQIGIIEDDYRALAFEELHLNIKTIEKTLNKFDLLETTNKYNI